jgi:hypothetical protein
MKRIFKVGDIVRLNSKLLVDGNGDLPYWWTPDNFMILDFVIKDNEVDLDKDGFPLVVVNINFKEKDYSEVAKGDGVPRNTVTTQWLLPDIKAQRRMKLERIGMCDGLQSCWI